MSTNLPAALAALARRLQSLPGSAQRVTSPLGVWLLLATVARAAEPHEPPPELDAALGMPRGEALAVADRLVAAPHPVVLNAFAAWVREDRLTERVSAFLEALPGEVTSGPMPTQEAADAWARSRTEGLITRYPISLDPSVLLTLANALACKVGWREPFGTTPAERLGAGPFTGMVIRALRATPGVGHGGWVADSAVGRVAVHVARAEGLDVWSVIADPGVAPVDVVAAAHEIASSRPARVSLGDLPLGDGPAWTVAETTATVSPAERHHGRVTEVTLPAWSARADLDLMADPRLGFAAAGPVLGRLVDAAGLAIEARQSVVARYHREGFEAAAVTAVTARTSAVVAEEGPLRVARLRFAHPYAVVAVARPTAPRGAEPDPWDGIPVFSAWVAQPEEPGD